MFIFLTGLWKAPRSLRSSLLATAFVGSGLLGGLSPPSQAQSPSLVEDCNQLAEAVNQSKSAIEIFETEVRSFGQNASQAETLDDIKQVAQQYVDAVDTVVDRLETMGAELETLPLSDEQLLSYRDRYGVVITGLGDALTILSEAMGGIAGVESQEDLADKLQTLQSETGRAVEQVGELSAQEATVVEEINAHCGVPEG